MARASLIGFVFLLCVGIVAAEQLELVPSKDTTIFQDSGGLSNGSGRYLFSGTTADRNAGLIRRALLAFDLSEIPVGATVTEVSLDLRVSKVPRGFAPDSEMGLHRLLQGFGEGTSDALGNEGKGIGAAVGDSTWTDAIVGATQWNNDGGDFVDDPSSTTVVRGLGSYTWPSTEALVDDVQHWLDNPDLNFGWALVADESFNKSARRFDSRETTSRGTPRLTIDFELAPPGLEGDFNGDGILNGPDVDLLCAEIGGDKTDPFDLNGDTSITMDDVTNWVEVVAGTAFGDADVDKKVAFPDFLALSSNFAMDGKGWEHGDFDCSSSVAFPDFLTLSSNFNFSAEGALASVPEPHPATLIFSAVLLGGLARRKQSSNKLP